MEQPRLKAHFSAEIVDGSKVFLVAEDEHYLIQGTGAVKVLPYLDGQHTVAQIAEALASELSLAATVGAIRRFAAYDVLAEGPGPLPGGELAFWDALRDPAADPAARATASVEVVAVGAADPAPVLQALVDSGINIAGGADVAALTVVITNDYLDPALGAISKAFLHTGQRWMLAKPTGLVLWLGPLLVPGRTGCWHCLEQRLAGNRQVEDYLRGKQASAVVASRSAPARTPHSGLVFAGMLAGEVTKIVEGRPAALEGKMVTLDLRGLGTAEHVLVRQPQCRECGDPSLTAVRSPKVVISPGVAGHAMDGGYRVQQPGETLARLKHHISPYLGAISSLHTFAPYDNGLTYAYSAGHNFAMVADNMNLLRRNLRGQSGGKGRTDLQARVSAVCEAVERYCGVWRGDEPVTRAPYADLGPQAAVHPDELLMFSPAQFAGRHRWNQHPANRLQIVPDPFDVTRPVDWSAAWSLSQDTERKVPAAYAWFGHPDLNEHFYCYSDSNGNASGNTAEEAILQGFCEIAERDAVALWWYNRIPRPGFDLDSLQDPYIAALRAHYQQAGRSLWLLDITSDLGLPVFVGVSHRAGHPAEDVLIGFGAHLDPRVAAIRALTEVNQFLPSVERRDEHGMTFYLEDDPATLAWLRETKVAAEPWLVPDPGQPLRTLADYPWQHGPDLGRDVEVCVELAGRAGLEVIVLNQTRPDIELSVVKVLVPGTRHFWRRLGAGRLYDVPVRLGWLDRPRREDELNPRSVFF